MQLGTIATVLVVVVAIVVMWRRYPRHPILLCAIACTAIVWMDPIMNWAPYAVYNPQLWHLPNDWVLVRLSPTVEPFVVLGYVTFYLGPFFPAIWILRRLQRRRPVESFVWRHPLISLAVLIYVIGFVYDALLEIFCVRTGLYIYSQVIPFGSVFTGKAYQFPLLWESSLVTLVMIPAGGPPVPRRHRPDRGREAGPTVQAVRQAPGAGDLRGDVRHPPARLRGLRRRLRRHPLDQDGDLGGLPVPVSRGQGLRPEGLLRQERPTGPVLPGHLGRMDVEAAGRPPERAHQPGRSLQPQNLGK